jgi:hypothetical protein
MRLSSTFYPGLNPLILHPRYFIHHTYLYSINASLFATIHYLAVAPMPPKRSRVNSLQSASVSKRNKVAPRYRGTASQPVLVDTQLSSPSPLLPPLLSLRQAIVAASQAPNFEATLRESRAKDTIIARTEGSEKATVAASKATDKRIENGFALQRLDLATCSSQPCTYPKLCGHTLLAMQSSCSTNIQHWQYHAARPLVRCSLSI